MSEAERLSDGVPVRRRGGEEVEPAVLKLQVAGTPRDAGAMRQRYWRR
jgi:hypothetical protein